MQPSQTNTAHNNATILYPGPAAARTECWSGRQPGGTYHTSTQPTHHPPIPPIPRDRQYCNRHNSYSVGSQAEGVSEYSAGHGSRLSDNLAPHKEVHRHTIPQRENRHHVCHMPQRWCSWQAQLEVLLAPQPSSSTYLRPLERKHPQPPSIQECNNTAHHSATQHRAARQARCLRKPGLGPS